MAEHVLVSTVLLITGLLAASTASAQTCDDESLRPTPAMNDVFRRYHASGCWVETDHIDDYHVDENGTSNGSSGLESRRRDLYCPIINDDLMSLDPANQYAQVTLSGYDHAGSGHDNLLIASHCVADPFSIVTECDSQVWSGSGCYGSVGGYWFDGDCAIDAQFGGYTLNVRVVPRDSSYADFYSFIGVSLAKEDDSSISGYEVSRCSTGEGNCDVFWPSCS